MPAAIRYVSGLPHFETFFPGRPQIWSHSLPVHYVSSTSQQLEFPEVADAHQDASLLPCVHYAMPAHIEVDDTAQVQVVPPVLQTADLPAAEPTVEWGWNELACYINPDNSLTQAGKELAEAAEQQALCYRGNEPRKISFPIMLACIAKNPRIRDDIEVFRGRHFIRDSPGIYIQPNGVLTAIGIIHGYAYLEKAFATFTVKQFGDLIKRRRALGRAFTEIDMFKQYGINPLAARQIVSFNKVGDHKFTRYGLRWVRENRYRVSPFEPGLSAQQSASV